MKSVRLASRSGGRVLILGSLGFLLGLDALRKPVVFDGRCSYVFFLFLNDCALILSLCGETINDDFNVRLVTSYALYPAVVTHISHSVILFSNVLKIMPPPPFQCRHVSCT